METTTKTLILVAAAAALLAPAAAAQSDAITKNYWFPSASAYGPLVCGQESDPGGETLGLDDHGIGGACFDVSGVDGEISLFARDHADDPPGDAADPRDMNPDYNWIIGGYYHLDDPDKVTPGETPADPILERTNTDLHRHVDPESTEDLFDEPQDWHPFCTHGRDIANAEGTPVTIDVTGVDTLKVRVDALYISTVQCEHYHDAHRKSPLFHANHAARRLSNGNPTGTPPTAGTITISK